MSFILGIKKELLSQIKNQLTSLEMGDFKEKFHQQRQGVTGIQKAGGAFGDHF